MTQFILSLLCCNCQKTSHSLFRGAGCVETYLTLIETVSLVRLAICYWATRRILVTQVNHYCFITENRSSSLYTSVGTSMHRSNVPFFSYEGCCVNTQW